jgi:hypothetical protein
MIPVVMLAINTGALSSLFLTLLCLTVIHPFIEHFPVIFLMTVALRAAIAMSLEGPLMHRNLLSKIVDGTQLTYLMLSLLINISATLIIALEVWCVRVLGIFGKQFVDCDWIEYTIYLYIQEIPQITIRNRD